MNTQKTTSSRCLYSPIVELRQYTLLPGKREVLIELFEREFIESQEVLGMQVIGIFRDLDDPNRFVWLRGYRDMQTRAEALKAFYVDGSVWKTHREAAVSTMIDSDNVLLLRPARPASGFALDPSDLPPPGATEFSAGLIVANICPLYAPGDGKFLDVFEGSLVPALTAYGATILAYFVTEESPNTFTALPVREGEQVFVWFSRFQDQASYDAHVTALARSRQWQDEIWPRVTQLLAASPEALKLSPTARSLLRG